jgi:hypothetical protein
LTDKPFGSPIDITSIGSGTIIVTGQRPPKVVSLCVGKNENSSHDDIIITVNRTLYDYTTGLEYDGFTAEMMSRVFTLEEVYNLSANRSERCAFLDFSTTQNLITPASATLSISARYYKNLVSVMADGNYVGDFYPTLDPADSTMCIITLPFAATSVDAGFKYQTKVKTLRLDAGAVSETSQGSIQKIDQATVRLTKTLGCKIGPDEDHLDPVLFREPSDLMSRGPRLFTGDKIINFDSSPDSESQVVVVQDEPYPMYINAVIFRGVTND